MKKYFFYFFLLFSTVSFAQDKSFDIVIGSGKYWTPARKPIDGGGFFNGEFEYHYKNRWSFAAGAVMTRYFYKNKLYPTNPFLGNSLLRGNEFQTNFLAKYKVHSSKFLTFQIGAGLGLITMGNESYVYNSQMGSYGYFQSNSDLGFPLSAELYTKITKNILVGAKFGSFIFPDYPIIGNNIGLQARFRL